MQEQDFTKYLEPLEGMTYREWVKLKKVIKQGGTTVLQPLNPEYEPMFFVGSAGEPSLEIMGVVVEIRRKL